MLFFFFSFFLPLSVTHACKHALAALLNMHLFVCLVCCLVIFPAKTCFCHLFPTKPKIVYYSLLSLSLSLSLSLVPLSPSMRVCVCVCVCLCVEGFSVDGDLYSPVTERHMWSLLAE